MRRFTIVWAAPVLLIGVVSQLAHADAKSRATSEAAEYVIQRFGRQAVKEGAELLAQNIEKAAARHGVEVIGAVRKVGPRALPLLEHAAQAAKVMARHGEAGAASVVCRPAAMTLVARHGEQAAAVFVKHAGGVAEPVVAKFGAPALRALEASGPQAGRRLAMLAEEGALAKIGRTEAVLEVVAKYGDRATKFIWENKGALAVGATLTAFLANPEPFLNGAQKVTTTVAEDTLRPVAEVPGVVAKGVAEGTNWTLVLLGTLGVGTGIWAARGWRRKA